MVIEVWLRPETVAGRQTVLGRYEEENNRGSFRLSIQGGQVVFEYSGSGGSDYLGKGGGLRSEQRLLAGHWIASFPQPRWRQGRRYKRGARLYGRCPGLIA